MSGNNSYIKSMNGIVSFDSNGTTIEGDNITSGEIDCTTLNATDVNATGSLNTSYIFVDYMDKNVTSYITFISDVLFDYKLYASNLWPSTGTSIIINGFLNIINGLKTSTIEGIDTNSLTKQLKIGQDNDYTTSINIGRKELTIFGTVYPAIPPRTTFYAIGDDDIVNKKYVDTVTGGSSILNSTNIWTGTSNTFNNVIYTSKIDSITPSSAYNLLTNNTAGINIGTSSSIITLGSSATPVRCPYVPLITTDICNKLYVDTVSSSAGSSLLSLTNTWTGTSNTFNNTVDIGGYYTFSGVNINGIDGQTYGILNNITTSNVRIGHSMVSGTMAIANNKTSGYVAIGGAAGGCATITNGNLLCHKGIFLDTPTNFIDCDQNITTIGLFNSFKTGYIDFCMGLTSGYVNMCKTFVMYPDNFLYNNSNTSFNLFSNLLSTVTMNMGGAGTVKLCNTIDVTSNSIASGGVGDTINLFNNITTGSVNMCKIIFQANTIATAAVSDTFNLLNNITTGTINFCNGLTTAGLLQIGAGKVKIGTSQISGYSTFGTSTGNFSIPSTINVSNYLFVATGTNATQVLTLPSYIDTQIINIRNNKTGTSLVIQCFGTQSLRLKNNGTATNITVGANTTTILIGTSTTWYYFL